MRIRPALELGQVLVKMSSTLLRGVDHLGEADGLGFERLDLSLDPVPRVIDEGAPLRRVMRRSEALAIALAGRLVLEQLADLGKREARLVAQLFDGAQSLEIGRVVEAVGALGASGGLEETDLLVVADR